MQPTSNTSASPIQLPQVDTDEPVAVIPLASVAPLDGPPVGERINTFALQSKQSDGSFAEFADKTRDSVRAHPLASLVLAFSLGYLLARR
jgi:hypothetical protein